MKEKKPWFVRLEHLMLSTNPTRKEKVRDALICVAIFILMGAMAYGIFCYKSSIPYEEAYDVEYAAYVNERLEAVANEVLDKNTGINLGKMPEEVSKYEINYVGNIIKFNYWLDCEQIISEYYSETGKTPKDSDLEKNMKMAVEISADFQEVSMLTSSDTIPTKERYENVLPMDAFIMILLYFMQILAVFAALMIVLIVLSDSLTRRWNKKQLQN